MKRIVMIASLLLAALSPFAIGAPAQHSQHHPSQKAPETASQAAAIMHCGMMSEQMMARHQEMENLVDRLLNSFASLNNEKTPEALENRLREHGALLDELRSKIQQRSDMMQKMMEQMKEHPMMRGEQE